MPENAQILRVDLTKGTTSVQEVGSAILRKYIGGVGLAAKILWDETGVRTRPLSEDNRLIFALGPLSGTLVPGSSRYVAGGLSPLTGIWGEAHGGGSWAHALARTPYSAIVVQGKAAQPVYLWLNEDKCELREARHLWGKDSFETPQLVQRETDEKAAVLVIGQAGERLVKFASIMSEGPASRAAARCGLGALMGYQNLKAVAVKGSKKPRVEEAEKLRSSVNRHFPRVVFNAQKHREKSDGIWLNHANKKGCIKNWTRGKFDGFGEKLAEIQRKGQPWYCAGCRTGCIISMMYRGQRHFHGEFVLPFGSNCLIDDMDALLQANELCNQFGVDTQSAGHVMAFAMELYDRGIITAQDTGGIQLVWGDGQAMLRMLRRILDREGLGAVLGEGVRAAAQQIGGEASRYAMHVKGLEFPLYDPRCNNAYALQFATSNRGADHLEGLVGLYGHGISPLHRDVYAASHLKNEDARRAAIDPFAVPGQAELVAWAQDFDCVLDALGICKLLGLPMSWFREPEEHFSGIKPEVFLEWLNLVTGWNLDLAGLMQSGERIFNLKRMLNVRRGIARKDDTLPARFLTEKRGGEGPQADHLPPLEPMLDEYYSFRGWNKDGIPSPEKLRELGLDEG